MNKTAQKRQYSPSKTIFIVEDHPAFREGLMHIVDSDEGFVVCGKAGDATRAYEGVMELKPDLALVDITLPGKSGLDLIENIRKVNTTTKILVVSMHDEALYADRVLRAGGDGYIMKQEDSEEIIQAIHDVLDGHIYVSEAVMDRMEKKSEKLRALKEPGSWIDCLTDEELAVLGLLGMGRSNSEIASTLKIHVKDVTRHYAMMRTKLGLKGNNELIRYAVCWVEAGTT